MTAEVAILNKIGVALAADSTVTITTANGDKTYNTTNKLFTLSKFHPVGIMMWNGTEFNGVPFELIIKEFRESLGRRSKRTISEYGASFVRHLKTKSHATKENQAYNFRSVMTDFCRSIQMEFMEACHNGAIPLGLALKGESLECFNDILKKFETNIAGAGKDANFRGVTPAQLQARYKGVVEQIVTRVFSRHKLTTAQRRRFVALLHKAAMAHIISDDFTGFVIAGFGASEHFPSVISYKTDGMYAGRVKLIVDRKRSVTHE
jgi:hypothetical protein